MISRLFIALAAVLFTAFFVGADASQFRDPDDSLFRPPSNQINSREYTLHESTRERYAYHAHGERYYGAVAARGEVADIVRRVADANGVPERYALAIARIENGFRMSGCSSTGACGPMQVLRSTARHMGVSGSMNGINGIVAGVRYIKYLMAAQGRFGECAVLSAYAHGEGFVRCTSYGRMAMALAAGAPSVRSTGIWLADWRAPRRHRRHHRWT